MGEDVLSTELQQLGLPAENAEAVGRGLRENREAMTATLRMKFVTCKSYSVPRLKGVEWRYDYDLVKTQPEVELRLLHTAGTTQFSVSQAQLSLLLHELSKARSQMNSLIA